MHQVLGRRRVHAVYRIFGAMLHFHSTHSTNGSHFLLPFPPSLICLSIESKFPPIRHEQGLYGISSRHAPSITHSRFFDGPFVNGREITSDCITRGSWASSAGIVGKLSGDRGRVPRGSRAGSSRIEGRFLGVLVTCPTTIKTPLRPVLHA